MSAAQNGYAALGLILHSKSFVQGWRALLTGLYGYQERDGAMRVPGLLGGHTAVYLPLLNYSDLDLAQAQALRQRWSGSAYQVRVLDPAVQTFEPNDTVTMRLDIAGLTAPQVFEQRIHSKCRNQIRKAEKSGMVWTEGREGEVVRDFYRVFASTMHRYGTPVFSRRLFESLPQHVDARFLVAYFEGQPVAGLCLVTDGPIAWVPWAGSEHAHRGLCPNHLLYWNAIQKAVAGGQQVFDFGRSGYLGPTFVFKRDWGAQPVRIAILTHRTQDVYSKYALASTVWKQLPRRVVNQVGPYLCRHLPDL